ncbi:glutaminyl-peptide cyclotransferase [Novosphingobium sp. ZN18A2]|uniref:glutaminyl-peptide cyclotransferase n=1 Tax=Novosphingobium sp. ZN18A2 TaxID=3079861 RepID=UPI0030D110A2
MSLLRAPPLALFAAGVLPAAAHADIPVCDYTVVRSYPHGTGDFTEGLFYREGLLYESTGEPGHSRIVVRKLDSLKPLREARIPAPLFGEGVIDWGDQLISLTWRAGIGYRWDRKTLRNTGTFTYKGEGWGMTRDGNTIYQSDGSSTLLLRDPATMKVTGTLPVTAEGRAVPLLNELEWINGEIWANVWMTDSIARIDPASGKVKAWIDLSGLRTRAKGYGQDDVLNGIAWDAKHHRVFVTGKNWNQLFQIRLKPPCKMPAGKREARQ